MDSRFQGQKGSQGEHLDIARPGPYCSRPLICVFTVCANASCLLLHTPLTKTAKYSVGFTPPTQPDPVAQKTGVRVGTAKMLIAFLYKILYLRSFPTLPKSLYFKRSGWRGLDISVQTAQHLHTVKVLCHHECSELTMSSFNFHLHCLKCLTKVNILDSSLFSPFLNEMYVNLGKKLTTFLENSVGSRDEQMAPRNQRVKDDYLLCTNMLMREPYFWDTMKILDLIQIPRWSSEQNNYHNLISYSK